MKKLFLLFFFFVTTWSSAQGQVKANVSQTSTPLPIKVVQIAFIEPELKLWIQDPSLEKIEIPEMFSGHIFLDRKVGRISFLAGLGTANVAASVAILLQQKQFDFSKSYFLLTGISGGDPEDVSLGSVVISDYIVDADLKHSLDEKLLPSDWKTGRIPFEKKKPYELPVKHTIGIESFTLNKELIKKAKSIADKVSLQESPSLQKKRDLYKRYPVSQKKPSIFVGANLAGLDFWHGETLNHWANDWVRYHTENQGNFMTSAMEDSGVLLALTRHKNTIDLSRVLSLRSISNYTVEPDGMTALESLTQEQEGYSAFEDSIQNLYRVGKAIMDSFLKAS